MQNQSKSSRLQSPLVSIFLTVFIYLIGFGVIIPILPIWAQHFGASPFVVGSLMTVYSLMQFMFAPFWGKLSDRYGRRPILLFCLLGEVVAYLVLAMARSLEFLFVARILAGFFGASISTASAYVSDITPNEKRSQGMAIIGVAFGLGFLIGPALGGGLTLVGQKISPDPEFGPAFAAICVAGLCLFNFFFSLKRLKESLPPEKRSLATARRSKRFELLKNYFAQPVLGKVMLLFAFASLSMSLMEASLVIWVGDQFQWTLKEVSFGFAYIGLITILSQGIFVRKLLAHWGERRTLFLGLFLMGIAFTSIMFMPTPAWLAVSMTLLSIGNSFTNPSIMGSVSLLAPAEKQGEALGVTQSLASLGRIVGPASGGWMYQAIGKGSPFLTGGILCAISLVVVIFEFKKLPNHAQVVK